MIIFLGSFQYIRDWVESKKLKPENGGSFSKLNDVQSRALEAHLEEKTYTRVIDICAYIEKKFGVHYTVSGLTKWLHNHNFRYKKPKAVPAKADIAKQEEFIEKYTDIRHETENDSYAAFEGVLENDRPILAIINTTLLDWDGKASHPWIATLRINYDGTATNGMPDQKTYDLMDKFEDELMVSLPHDIGYLNIGRETADNLREVYLACTEFRKSSQTIDQLITQYQNDLQIDYTIYKDKYWKSFERFNRTVE